MTQTCMWPVYCIATRGWETWGDIYWQIPQCQSQKSHGWNRWVDLKLSKTNSSLRAQIKKKSLWNIRGSSSMMTGGHGFTALLGELCIYWRANLPFEEVEHFQIAPSQGWQVDCIELGQTERQAGRQVGRQQAEQAADDHPIYSSYETSLAW